MWASLLLNLIVPFVMVLVGTLLKKYPISDMNRQNGYSTPIARKSQAHWEYAQQIAPDIYIRLGKYLFIAEIVVSILLLFLHISIKNSIIIGSCIGFTFLFYSFYYTDGKIKERFMNKS